MATPKGATRARPAATDKKTEDARIAELAKVAIDDLFSVGRASAAHRIAVHGDHGVGKTTFLSHCPGVIFLPIEDGANQHRVPQWKEKISSLADFDRAILTLRHSRHDFKAVAVETLAALEELIKSAIEARLAATAGKDGVASLAELNEEEFGAGYDLLRDEWRRVLGMFDELREHRGMHILLSCPTKIDTVRRLNAPDYQRHGLQLTGKKAANLIKGWCDYVLYFEMEVNVTKEGRRTVQGLGDRVIRCTQQATHDAKCRGEIPWPDALPLDEREAWSIFVQTAELIADKGTDLIPWLGKEFARAVETLPAKDGNSKETRRAKASDIFEKAIARRDYRMAKTIVEVIDDERKTEAKEKKNGAAIAGGRVEPPEPNGAEVHL